MHKAEPQDALTANFAYFLQGSSPHKKGSGAPGYTPCIHADALYQPIAWLGLRIAADTSSKQPQKYKYDPAFRVCAKIATRRQVVEQNSRMCLGGLDSSLSPASCLASIVSAFCSWLTWCLSVRTFVQEAFVRGSREVGLASAPAEEQEIR